MDSHRSEIATVEYGAGYDILKCNDWVFRVYRILSKVRPIYTDGTEPAYSVMSPAPVLVVRNLESRVSSLESQVSSLKSRIPIPCSTGSSDGKLATPTACRESVEFRPLSVRRHQSPTRFSVAPVRHGPVSSRVTALYYCSSGSSGPARRL